MSKSILVTGVPPERGTPIHYDDTKDAFTLIDRNNRVTEMGTPDEVLLRVHELMHALNTKYPGPKGWQRYVPDGVYQLVEDCRLHLTCWPWPAGTTPRQIEEPSREYLAKENNDLRKALADGVLKSTDFMPFFCGMRSTAVMSGITGSTPYQCREHLPDYLSGFAIRCIRMIEHGRVAEAAFAIRDRFFPPKPEEERPKGPVKKPGKITKRGRGRGTYRVDNPVEMEIFDLVKTVRTSSEIDGTRIATSGARIHRPALRRPVLSPRLFVRTSPNMPGGTTLVDASGSMGDISYIERVLKADVMGTIAYYAGLGRRKGWLYIYARDGWRAENLVIPPEAGNTVDGPALDWLLGQPGPRVFITDREFCGAPDSELQILRLRKAEDDGLVTVRHYQDGVDQDE